jgi:spore coat polysaccharide biosynthesis protein SpsF (cytidylyltransferase family)
MTDVSTGDIKEDILNEKILSAIVEFKTSLANVPTVLRKVREVAGRLDTIVAIGAAVRCDDNGDNELEEILRQEEFNFVRGKTNLGLGRASGAAKEQPEPQTVAVM